MKKSSQPKRAAQTKSNEAPKSPPKEASTSGEGVVYNCKVIGRSDGQAVKIGSMLCFDGAVARLSEERAKAAAREGLVSIVGIA